MAVVAPDGEAGPARAVAPRRGRGAIGASAVVTGAAALLLLVLVGYPLLWLLMAAFGLPAAFRLDAVAQVFVKPENFEALANTLILALGTGVIGVILGVPLAWATARSDMPLKRLVQALVALTYIAPPYLTAFAYIILLGPNSGYFNRILQWTFGFARGPIDIFSMGGVIFVVGMHAFVFTYFMTHSALKSVDASLDEAGEILGAGRWHRIRRIDLPLVAPAIAGGALLAAVDSMALFGPQAFLGLPAQVTFLPTRIFGVLGSYPPRWTEAAALSLILVILTVLGLLAERSYLGRRSYITVGGRGARVQTMALGLWRWPMLAFCLVVTFLSAIAPVVVIAYAAFAKRWTDPLSLANLTLEQFRTALFDSQIVGRSIVNSFALAIGAGLATVAIGTCISYLDQRTTFRGRRFLDYLAILPLGLPGTVMGLAILIAFIRPPLVLYGTIWILLVAYIARFVPVATRSMSATLRQLDPSLEEAARISGASWLRAIWTILLPLARPGLAVAFLLVLVSALAELSASILLYASGTETIAVAIFSLNYAGQLEPLSALALFTIVVTLVVSLPLSWLTNRDPAASVVRTDGA